MADLLNIGVNGLLSYQQSLSTVSHNITNVNTEGYTRQRVELTNQTPQYVGVGYEGTGVRVDSIQRVYDKFLSGQVTSTVSSFKQQETLARFTNEIDDYLADPQAGLTPALQNFFKSVQDLSTDPSSTPIRQVLLSDARNLQSSFNDSYQKLKRLQDGVNVELDSGVNEINNLSQAIANLNKSITFAQGGNAGAQPNDLIDQRDNLVNKLAEYVSVTTVPQDDGSLNVFIGNGQSLVVGTKAQQLAITPNQYDPTRAEVGLVFGASTVTISDNLTGGSIGGALQFRKLTLDPAFNALGRVAIGLAESFNTQHQLGYDLTGQMGGNFFTDISQTASYASSRNAVGSDYVFSTDISDVSLLSNSDYRISYSSGGGGTYSLTRLSDNSLIGSSNSVAGLSTIASANEGFTLALSSGTSISNGDSFLLQPTRSGGRDFAGALNNTNNIAAASPIRTAKQSANTGTADISGGVLSSRSGATLPATPITMTFDNSSNVFNLSSGGTFAYDPATDSGNTQSVTIAGLGVFDFTISGTPASGDQFSLSANTNGVSDNRNALSLLGLQETKLLSGNSATYQDAYGDLVSQVGVQARQADFSSQANQVIYDRAVSQRQEVSGVNLDEEAADLLRFQQAYQAIAQVITTADQLFQTLLGAVSR